MLIGHRCIHCGHPDYWSVSARNRGSAAAGKLVAGHSLTGVTTPYRSNCGDRECERCRRAGCRYGPSEFFTRYHADAFGAEVDDICEPGTESTGVERTSNRIYSCACDECHALYAEAMAAKPVQPKPLPPRMPRPLPNPLPPPPPKPTPSTPQKYAQKGLRP